MIYTYNETNSAQWKMIDKNEHFYRFTLVDSFFGIDVLKRGIEDEFICTEVFDSINKTTNVLMVSASSAIVCYNNKTGLPFLKGTTNSRYAQDVYLISYKIPKDCPIIVNERSGKIGIHYYKIDKENSVIHMVATCKPDNMPYYYLTFTNEDHSKFVTKHLVTSKKTMAINIFTHEYTAKEVEESKYASTIIGKRDLSPITQLKTFKVNCPYGVIIYPFSVSSVREDICERKFGRDEKFTAYVNTESPNAYKELRALIANGHKAATFYVSDINSDQLKELSNKYVKFSKMFERVNYITKDGKVLSL